jgi:hypothetical protein
MGKLYGLSHIDAEGRYGTRLMMDIADLKVIMLDRGDKDTIVRSFDHYLKHQLRGQTDLRAVYPIFQKRYTTGAIDAAVDRYLYKQAVLRKVYKGKILTIMTNQLNDETFQHHILNFIGIPVDKRVMGMPVLNKRKEMSKAPADAAFEKKRVYL